MVIPWVKAGILSLNAATSATVGGVCTYCIFGGESQYQKEQKLDSIRLTLKEIRDNHEIEKKDVEKTEASLLVEEEAKLGKLSSTYKCLEEMEKHYENERANLLKRWFQNIKYWGENCL